MFEWFCCFLLLGFSLCVSLFFHPSLLPFKQRVPSFSYLPYHTLHIIQAQRHLVEQRVNTTRPWMPATQGSVPCIHSNPASPPSLTQMLHRYDIHLAAQYTPRRENLGAKLTLSTTRKERTRILSSPLEQYRTKIKEEKGYQSGR